MDLKKLSDNFDAILSIAGKCILLALTILVLSLILLTVTKGGYSISRFEVPASFEAEGTSGSILARLLADEIERIRESAFYKLKEINEERLLEEEDDPLSGAISVPGVELTIEDVLRYLGLDKRKEINGELLLRGRTLRLDVRIPGEGTVVFAEALDGTDEPGSRYRALDALIASAGKFLMEKINPMVLAYSYYSELTDEGIKASVDLSRKVIESNHRDAKIAHYLIADRMYHHYGDTRESLEQLAKALGLDPDFAPAWFFKGGIMLHPHAVEIPGQPLQTLEEIYGKETEKADRLKKAIRFYERGLRAQPKDFFALIYLAEIYAFEKESPTKQDLKKAVSYYERAKKYQQEYFDEHPSKSASFGEKKLKRYEDVLAKLR